MSSQKIALEGRTRLPGRIQDVIVDCGSAVTQALNGSGSNAVLHATLKSFSNMDSVIDNTINNVNKLESLVHHMNTQLNNVESK
uniref:BLOC-1-related complex subunit 7 n=1 Tax=Steinernema glaseri TaxID=37863 RepID=A0A1I7YYR7_9BILA